MATQRMINTNFWKDTYIENLDPIEKLLFLYLLTNPNTNIAGIYEISLRQIAFDTGIDKDMIAKILERFKNDHKVYYNQNWVALYNWIKHQAINPKVSDGITRIIENLPIWLKKDLLESDQAKLPLLEDDKIEPIDSLSKPIVLNLTKLNLTKLNLTAGTPANNLKNNKNKNQSVAKGEGYKKFQAQKKQLIEKKKLKA